MRDLIAVGLPPTIVSPFRGLPADQVAGDGFAGRVDDNRGWPGSGVLHCGDQSRKFQAVPAGVVGPVMRQQRAILLHDGVGPGTRIGLHVGGDVNLSGGVSRLRDSDRRSGFSHAPLSDDFFPIADLPAQDLVFVFLSQRKLAIG